MLNIFFVSTFRNIFSSKFLIADNYKTLKDSVFVTIYLLLVLYCLAYTADDDSLIYVVETFSFQNYSGLIFPP